MPLPFQVFRYDGSGPIVKKDVDVLWDAVWQPAGEGVYPDRPASPGRKGPTAADAAAREAFFLLLISFSVFLFSSLAVSFFSTSVGRSSA